MWAFKLLFSPREATEQFVQRHTGSEGVLCFRIQLLSSICYQSQERNSGILRITESSVALQKKLQLQKQVTESMPEPPGGPVESLSAMRRSASTYMTQLFRRIQEKKTGLVEQAKCGLGGTRQPYRSSRQGCRPMINTQVKS